MTIFVLYEMLSVLTYVKRLQRVLLLSRFISSCHSHDNSNRKCQISSRMSRTYPTSALIFLC